MKKSVYLCSSAVMVLMPAMGTLISNPVYAQDATSGQAVETVVVSAEKRDENIQTVPESVTALDPQTLLESGKVSLTDYFADVPGLTLTSGGNGNTYVVIRGLSAGQGQSPLVSTVIDDVPVMASNAAGEGQLSTPNLDPSDLARIEVLKGPQGTLYGADSVGGLIKYVTLDPSTDGFSGRVEVDNSNIPDGGVGYGLRASVNVPISDTVAIRISGFDRQDPGYITDLTTGQNNYNSATVYGTHVAALWRPSDDLTIKLTALFQEANGNDSIFNSNIKGQPVNGLTLTSLPGTTPYSTNNQLYSAHIDWKVAGLEVTSITGFGINKFVNAQDYTPLLGVTAYNCDHTLNPATCALAPGTPAGSVGVHETVEYETQKFSQELRVGSSIGDWLDWRLGGFFTNEVEPIAEQNYYGADPSSGALLFPNYTNIAKPQDYNEYAVFGDVTIHLADRFDIEGGARESWDRQEQQFTNTGAATYIFAGGPAPYVQPLDSASGSAFTFQVAPKFTISPDLMTYARIATGYRVGGWNTNAFLPAYSSVPIPSSFGPDKTTNYEVGVKGDLFDHILEYDAAAYLINWSQVQVNVKSTFPIAGGFGTVGYTVNGGEAVSKGLELSIDAHPIQGMTVSAQGSYDDAYIQHLPTGATISAPKGTLLPYSSKYSGGININQDFAISEDWTAFVGGAVNYVGERPQELLQSATATRIVYPGYTELDLRAGFREASWLFNLYLNNATDTRGILGIANAYNEGNTGGYTATITQPRTIGINITKTF